MDDESNSNEGSSAVFTLRGGAERQEPGASPHQADQINDGGSRSSFRKQRGTPIFLHLLKGPDFSMPFSSRGSSQRAPLFMLLSCFAFASKFEFVNLSRAENFTVIRMAF
jgi:hypothetical protein